jgi:hypothetical protein
MHMAEDDDEKNCSGDEQQQQKKNKSNSTRQMNNIISFYSLLHFCCCKKGKKKHKNIYFIHFSPALFSGSLFAEIQMMIFLFSGASSEKEEKAIKARK